MKKIKQIAFLKLVIILFFVVLATMYLIYYKEPALIFIKLLIPAFLYSILLSVIIIKMNSEIVHMGINMLKEPKIILWAIVFLLGTVVLFSSMKDLIFLFALLGY